MLVTRVNRPVVFRLMFRTPAVANFSNEKNSPPDDKNEAQTAKDGQKDTTTRKKAEKTSASDRLNRLLASMNTDDNVTLVKTVKVPKAGAKKLNRAGKKESSDKSKSQNIVQAAKDVADLIGDTTKQTESELLSKLLNNVGGGAGKEKDSAQNVGSSPNLSELIVGMKIDRSNKPRETATRSEFVRNTIASRHDKKDGMKFRSRDDNRDRQRRRLARQTETSTGSVNLFGEKLDIFKNPAALKGSPDILRTWAHLYNHELEMAVVHPPTNYFEKIIVWTEQGKIWRFPIDNEQGLENESKVDFSEHVFLEQHLEQWCPVKGPIRHFMELVCTGLSKNPYITANEKKEHILWYRDYFEKKKDILSEVIAQQKDITATGVEKVSN